MTEQVEVLSLVSDIAVRGDDKAVHAHVVVGPRDASTVGGTCSVPSSGRPSM